MGLVDSWAGVAGWMMGRRKWEGLASVAQREESAGLLVSLVSLQNGNIRGIIRQPPTYLTQNNHSIYTRGQLLMGPHGIQLVGGLK